jgi:endonuclease YncB( thermonuclease family)
MKSAALILSLTVLVPATVVASEAVWQCREVIDGDTIVVQSDAGLVLHVHLFGVDAPELEQPFGAEAKTFVEEAALGKAVRLSESEVTGSPVIASVEVGGEDLAEALARAGLAWLPQEGETSETIATALFVARSAGAGLWSDSSAEHPATWRTRHVVRPTPTPQPLLSTIAAGIDLPETDGKTVLIAGIPPRYTSQRETQMLVENMATIAAAAEALDEMEAAFTRECSSGRSNARSDGGSVWSEELNQWVDGTESTFEEACRTLDGNITRLRRSIVSARDRAADEARRFGVKPHIIREVVDYFDLARF